MPHSTKLFTVKELGFSEERGEMRIEGAVDIFSSYHFEEGGSD